MTSHSEALTEIAEAARVATYAAGVRGAAILPVAAALINYQAAQLIAGEIALLRDKLHDNVNENIWRGSK